MGARPKESLPKLIEDIKNLEKQLHELNKAMKKLQIALIPYYDALSLDNPVPNDPLTKTQLERLNKIYTHIDDLKKEKKLLLRQVRGFNDQMEQSESNLPNRTRTFSQ